MLDSTLLRNFMSHYFCHGNLSADYWFIGMESGGGRSEREVEGVVVHDDGHTFYEGHEEKDVVLIPNKTEDSE